MSLAADLAAMFERRRLIITVGAGGVGKTTVSAAIAMAGAAHHTGRVLVLTIDPARRLAEALGFEIADAPQRVPDDIMREAEIDPTGELWVSMLDTEAGWADLVERYAPDPSVADKIQRNRLFRNLTGRFVQSHGYLAMERLWQVASDFDLVVIDTPPSRNTLDILAAPQKMADFFGSNLLKWLTAPYRSRIISAASKPFNMVADRILGDRFMTDIAEFFSLFQQLAPAFVKHADEVEALLRHEAGFVAVTTLESTRVTETSYLVSEIERHGYQTIGAVANRTFESALGDPATGDALDALTTTKVKKKVAQRFGIDQADLDTTVDAVVRHAPALIGVAQRDESHAARLGAVLPSDLDVVRLPLRGSGIDSVRSLAELIGIDEQC